MKLAIIGLTLVSIVLLCSLPAIGATPSCGDEQYFCKNDYRNERIEQTTWWVMISCYTPYGGSEMCLWKQYLNHCKTLDIYEVCQWKRYCCGNNKWEAYGTSTETPKMKDVKECKTMLIASKTLPKGTNP
jgi:hypothetical protein